MRDLPATLWTTASWDPSGDHSASATSSSIWRGAPPETGTRASVPAGWNEFWSFESRPIARSFDGEIEKRRASGTATALEPGPVARVEKTFDFTPFHAAL